jgi:hypothetical protein
VRWEKSAVEVVHARCAGLDISKKDARVLNHEEPSIIRLHNDGDGSNGGRKSKRRLEVRSMMDDVTKPT